MSSNTCAAITDSATVCLSFLQNLMAKAWHYLPLQQTRLGSGLVQIALVPTSEDFSAHTMKKSF